MNNTIIFLFVLVNMLSHISWAQPSGKKQYKSMDNGLRYCFIHGKMRNANKMLQNGDRVQILSDFYLNDSLIQSKNEHYPQWIVMDNQLKDEWAFQYELPFEALHYMTKGDSAHFKISAAQFFAIQKIQPIPGWKDNDTLSWRIKIVDFESRSAFEKRMTTKRIVQDKFAPVDTFLEYKIIQLGKGGLIGDVGDLMYIHVNYAINDSIVFRSSTLDDGKALPQQIMPPGLPGDLMNGFVLLQAGDSAHFRILHKHYLITNPQGVYHKVDSNVYHSWNVKIESVKSKEQVELEKKNYLIKQNAHDNELIVKYLADKNWKPTYKLDNGLVYVETVKGKGAKPQNGQKVSVNYTGMFLDGKKFDSNVEAQFNHVVPLQFEIGKKQVITGWDEGLKLMNVGSKGYLLIPASLGYGNRAQGPIPANAVLLFEIELLEIL